MNCTMTCAVLLMGLVFTGLCQGFYKSTEKIAWSRQNDICIPATPKFRFSFENHIVDAKIGIDLPPNKPVWVGYYQVVRVFEYIGCVLMKNIFGIEDRPFVKKDGGPGECFPGCGDDSIVGVTGRQCYCLGSNWTSKDSTETRCTDDCFLSFAKCGKIKSSLKYSYFSIYKINKEVQAATLSGANKEASCLTLNPNSPKQYFWDTCNELLQPMCAFGDNVRTLKPKRKLSWAETADECFKGRSLPTTYLNSKKVDKEYGSNLWTGMFKANVVYKYNAKNLAEGRHEKKKFGILKKFSDDNLYLQFIDEDSNETVLCDDGKVVEDPIKTTITIGKSLSRELETAPSNYVPSVTMTNLNTTPKVEKTTTTILIGICVLLGVLLAAVSVAYLYRKRISSKGLIQANTSVNSAALQKNNETVPDHDYEEVDDVVSVAESHHYYTTPAEIVNHGDQGNAFVNKSYQAHKFENQSDQAQEIVNQSYQALQQVGNRTSEKYQSLDVVGREERILKSTPQTRIGIYETLQYRTAESHNYEEPTSITKQLY